MRQVLPDPARGLDEIDAVVVVLFEAGGDGEDIRVEDDVLRREIELLDQQVVGAFADLNLALEGISLSDLVERHHHHGRAVTACDPCFMKELVNAFLHGNRVDDRLALHAFQAGFDHVELRRVDHHRYAGDIRLGSNQIEEVDHRLLGVQQAFVHVDVDDLRAVLDLIARDLKRGGVIAVLDQLAEAGRAGDVGAFADVDERDVGGEVERLKAGQPQQRRNFGNDARLVRRAGFGNRLDVRRRGAAAAADHVDETGLCELADQPRHIFRALIVLAEFVGQASVRIGADQRVRDAADVGDVRAQIFGAERTVEADGDGIGVLDRIPERFRQLPGEQTSRFVGDGAGDHHRHMDAARLGDFGDGVERGLGV